MSLPGLSAPCRQDRGIRTELIFLQLLVSSNTVVPQYPQGLGFRIPGIPNFMGAQVPCNLPSPASVSRDEPADTEG